MRVDQRLTQHSDILEPHKKASDHAKSTPTDLSSQLAQQLQHLFGEMSRFGLLLVLAAGAALLADAATCPPPNFDSVSNFDIKKYVAGPWYIQEQVGGSDAAVHI
jgi:hypothetical protein